MMESTLGEILNRGLTGQLEEGWVYLAETTVVSLDTPCLVVQDSDWDTEETSSGDIATEQGFPVEGLNRDLIEDVIICARRFVDPPPAELLLESFIYYWRFDAFLPAPGAPDPPPPEESQKQMDREFYEILGPERTGQSCKTDGCNRGAIEHSLFCRVHHFEMVKRRLCPFDD
jgi:hypothetical protein